MENQVTVSLSDALTQLQVWKERVRVARVVDRELKKASRVAEKQKRKDKLLAIRQAKKILRDSKIKITDDDFVSA